MEKLDITIGIHKNKCAITTNTQIANMYKENPRVNKQVTQEEFKQLLSGSIEEVRTRLANILQVKLELDEAGKRLQELQNLHKAYEIQLETGDINSEIGIARCQGLTEEIGRITKRIVNNS